jgi:lipid A 4'-phosphatase
MGSNRAIAVTVALLVVNGGVFALWPGLDLATSHLFFVEGAFVGRSGLWPVARAFFNITPFIVLVAFVGLFLLRRSGASVAYAPTGPALAFLILTMAVGPGLVVNLGLKDHAHRPRPTQTQDFGGSHPFRPWYRFDGGCDKNCSFVGGEASEAFWMTAPASLVPPPYTPAALAGAAVFGVLTSLLRVAAGGHYLSDVIFGALLSVLIVQIALRLMLGLRPTSAYAEPLARANG